MCWGGDKKGEKRKGRKGREKRKRRRKEEGRRGRGRKEKGGKGKKKEEGGEEKRGGEGERKRGKGRSCLMSIKDTTGDFPCLSEFDTLLNPLRRRGGGKGGREGVPRELTTRLLSVVSVSG